MKCFTLSCLAIGLCACLATAQEKPAPAENPVHNELRRLKEKILEAFNKNDMDGLLACVHPNVVVTWQNGEVSRHHQGIRDYYQKMMQGPNRVVDQVTAQADVDELAILYGDDNALAFGNLDEDFTLTDRSQFHLKNRWTAQVVRHNGQWVVSALHVSANIFDNGVLHLALRRTALWTGLAAGAGGVLVGLFLYWIIRGRRPKIALGGTR
jgi:hypothetical protein